MHVRDTITGGKGWGQAGNMDEISFLINDFSQDGRRRIRWSGKNDGGPSRHSWLHLGIEVRENFFIQVVTNGVGETMSQTRLGLVPTGHGKSRQLNVCLFFVHIMKKLLKIVGALVVVFVLLVTGLLAYVTKFLPNVAVRELKVEVTPERVERGKYLANHVSACMDCHSTRDWAVFSAPLVEGTLGVGGEKFDQKQGFPGSFVAPNLTPHALASWSDGEIYRAITSGVSRDGRPLFPIMPYPAYRNMATEDVYSIIAYLRSLPPVVSSPETSKGDFPVSLIMHTMPQPAEPMEVPAKSDVVAYGAYLTQMAACSDCHTKMHKGKVVGEPFAGGFEFEMPGGVLKSMNITPHLTTGIGAWTKEQFVARFKAFAKENHVPVAVDMMKGDMQTVMPWTMYAEMTEEDLGAIYDYLKTLEPVENQVQAWTARSGSGN
jgi:hypothetical protein